jgi:hypothetical protein
MHNMQSIFALCHAYELKMEQTSSCPVYTNLKQARVYPLLRFFSEQPRKGEKGRSSVPRDEKNVPYDT